MVPPARRWAAALFVLLIAACSGASSTRPTTTGPVATALHLEPSTATLRPGQTVQLVATATDSSGKPIPGYAIDWSSSDTSVATVSDSGMVLTVASGTAGIVATGAGIADTATITVSASPPTSTLVSNLMPASYAIDSLYPGAVYYVDRSFTVTTVPSAYRSWTLIRTANNDKGLTADSAIQFDLADSATIAIAYDRRATALPGWLAAWSATADSLITSDAQASPFSIRTRAFGPGHVVLGGNLSDGAAGAQTMYVVFLTPGAPSSSATTPPVHLTWTAPTTSADGTDLSDLAGYRIYYGSTSPLDASNATIITTGTIDTSYCCLNLTPGMYHFAVSALDSSGNESGLSNEVSLVIP